MACAYGGPAPEELIFAQMLKFYGCLPSQLNNEPADEAYLYFQVNNIYEEAIAQKNRSKST